MSEWGFVNIGKEAQNIDIAEPLEPYSGVRLIVGVDENHDPIVYISGDESGRVLEVENPFGTQLMANAIYECVRGYQYQPLYVDGAILNPAAEIGDAISANGVYSGIYSRSTTFGALITSDISAPTNEEVIHEFNVLTPTERKFQRLTYDMQSQFKITSAEIEAKVSKTSPQEQTSFGWSLQNDQWTVFNQDGNILRATADGLEVTGKIEADEGYIGGENGFVIKASAIYNGISTFGGEGETGVYVGTNGIQLGQGFKADARGNVTATSLKITGGMIELGEKPVVPVPVVVDGYSYYRWGCAVDAERLPYFTVPDDVTFSGISATGISLWAGDYEVKGRTVRLLNSFVQKLGVGEHSGIRITTFDNPQYDPIETIARTDNPASFFGVKEIGQVTSEYHDWQYYRGTVDHPPYIVVRGPVIDSTEWNTLARYIRLVRWEINETTGQREETGTAIPLFEVNGNFTNRYVTVNGGRELHVEFQPDPSWVGFDFDTKDGNGQWTSGYYARIEYDLTYPPNKEQYYDYFYIDSPDFHVIRVDYNYHTVTAPTLVIEPSKGEQGYFCVTAGGAITASNITVDGGSININDKFIVTSGGDLTANSGTFRGTIYAGNIVSAAGGDEEAGYFDGAGLLGGSVSGGWEGAIADGTIETGNLVEGIISSLANGDYAASQLYNGFSSGININGNLVFQRSVVQWMPVRLANGGTAYAMCTYSR